MKTGSLPCSEFSKMSQNPKTTFPPQPDSTIIEVPETMMAVCPRHGEIASIAIQADYNVKQGRHWVVRCHRCGQPCTLVHVD